MSGQTFFIDFADDFKYLLSMDIATLSTGLSQAQVQMDAATQVQKLAMDSAESQGDALTKMMGETITDPALGATVDLLA